MIQTLGPPPLNTSLTVERRPGDHGEREKSYAVNLSEQLSLSKWLSMIYQIFAGIGAQLRASAILNFPLTPAQSSSDLTIAVVGADVTADPPQRVSLGSPIPPADSGYTAFVSAANVVTVRFMNFSAAGINPASGTFSIIVHT